MSDLIRTELKLIENQIQTLNDQLLTLPVGNYFLRSSIADKLSKLAKAERKLKALVKQHG